MAAVTIMSLMPKGLKKSKGKPMDEEDDFDLEDKDGEEGDLPTMDDEDFDMEDDKADDDVEFGDLMDEVDMAADECFAAVKNNDAKGFREAFRAAVKAVVEADEKEDDEEHKKMMK